MTRLYAPPVLAMALLTWLGPVRGAESLDKYGGALRVAGHPGASFHLEKIGQRWWAVTPEGHGIFIRAVGKVDVADYGGSGGFLACDGVYLETAAGAMSPPRACRATRCAATTSRRSCRRTSPRRPF